MIVICPHCGDVFEYAGPQQEHKISEEQINYIIDLCCDHFNVKKTKLFTNYRGKDVSKVRHIAMYLIYDEERSGLSLKEVAELFNRKDHSTVINARTRCKDSLFTKQDVYKDLLVLSYKVNEKKNCNPLKKAS